MNAIVAVDKNWGIGKDNDLLVHIPGDLEFYREKTLGKCILVGRKTLESLPGGKPLPKRDIILLTGNRDYKPKLRATMRMSTDPKSHDKPYTCTMCYSAEEAMEAVKAYERSHGKDSVYLCGGDRVYNLLIDQCNEVFVTKIDHSFDAEKFFPNVEERGYQVTWSSEPMFEDGYNYRFYKYERPCQI